MTELSKTCIFLMDLALILDLDCGSTEGMVDELLV